MQSAAPKTEMGHLQHTLREHVCCIHLSGWIQETTLDLCNKRELWSAAYFNPEGHRTSNMLDRLMRGMNRHYDVTQHLHGAAVVSRCFGPMKMAQQAAPATAPRIAMPTPNAVTNSITR